MKLSRPWLLVFITALVLSAFAAFLVVMAPTLGALIHAPRWRQDPAVERLQEEFSDIRVSKDSSATVGELAKDDLVNLRNPELIAGPLAAGQKAPPFEAIATDGTTVKFPESYKGKVVLLDFWATWCGPCVKEVPNVVDAYARFHPQGLEVLSVSLDQANAAEILAKFVKRVPRRL